MLYAVAMRYFEHDFGSVVSVFVAVSPRGVEGGRPREGGREESFNLPELERPQTQTRHAGLGPVSNNDFLHLSTN